MGNYSFKTTNLPEPVNGFIEGHNFTQGMPHTKIYEGVTGLTFRNCNLLNCDVPEDAIIQDSLHRQISFCSHQHQNLQEAGFITICEDNCEHVTASDSIVIDGIFVDSNFSYADKAVE